MKVLVPVKRVIDYNVRIQVKADESGVVTDNVKMSMNPFDEIAVEEAIRLKEAGKATEIILVSVGTSEWKETLREGLAMGADSAILVESEKALEPIHVAKILTKITAQVKPQLIILGKQAIDDDCNQTGQMLAALLNWPQGTFASALEIEAGHATVTREVDEGLETIKLTLPAVITTDLRLNEPRYMSLPNIMRARSKPMEVIALDSINVTVRQHTKVIKVTSPTARGSVEMLDNCEALVKKLKEQGVI